MLRNHIKAGPALQHFILRGKGDSRLEALSDGVFALAIAMLLLSTSVPETFDELWRLFSDLIPFGICSVFIFWIWRSQVIFFQRFGLTEDQRVIRLSFALLMLVLFYVYALKFLMNWLINFFSGGIRSLIYGLPLRETVGYLMEVVNFMDMPKLMLIYGLGFMGVFALFALLYRYVLQHQNTLELSPLERLETQHSSYQYQGMVVVGGVAVFFAVLGLFSDWPWFSFLSGVSYNLAIPFSFRLSSWRKKALDQAGLEREESND
ncbi:MAG: TMEM175 family protein [Bacteroidota bacterium]